MDLNNDESFMIAMKERSIIKYCNIAANAWKHSQHLKYGLDRHRLSIQHAIDRIKQTNKWKSNAG